MISRLPGCSAVLDSKVWKKADALKSNAVKAEEAGRDGVHQEKASPKPGRGTTAYL